MAIIEIKSNDLELLQDDFTKVQTKMDALREALGKNFALEKQLGLFVNGLDKMDRSMGSISEDASETTRLIKMFNEEIANLEEVFAKKFDDIDIPNIESVDSDVFDMISKGSVGVEPTRAPDLESGTGGTEEEQYSDEYSDIGEVPLYNMSDDEGGMEEEQYAEGYDGVEEVPLYDMSDGDDEISFADGEEAGNISDEELAETELEELLRASEEEAAVGGNSQGVASNYSSSSMSNDAPSAEIPLVSSVNDTLTDSIAESMANLDLGGGEA